MVEAKESDIAFRKNKLRQELKSIRLSLSQEQRRTYSRRINARLEHAAEWSKLKRVHLYEPIARLNEVDTTEFINWLSLNYPKLKLFTSRQFNNVWQVCEYKSGQVLETPELDIVIVPMLGFDENLERIGYGGGYYDKFLGTQTRAFKLGVCFESGKVARVPTEDHDVRLDKIITETAVYSPSI